MKKIIHYFLIVAVIFFLTLLAVSSFYTRSIYKKLLTVNKSEFPSFMIKILDRLTSQPVVQSPILREENTIQILEGWTNNDIAKYLAANGNWGSQDFLQSVGSAQTGDIYLKKTASSTDYSLQFSFLKDLHKNASLEGYLFPDTYRIYASSTIDEIIVRMLNNFDEKLTSKMRLDIKAQGKTIFDIIIMASLVEKEAPINYNKDSNNYDAKVIAGIFWNRLKNGQALESDATLSYILKDNQSQHRGQDLEINSLYNTYKYRGLPPGPISNPGLVAIEAAIYPIKSSYNYFLSPPDGKTVIYAITYDQHLSNKYKYLK